MSPALHQSGRGLRHVTLIKPLDAFLQGRQEQNRLASSLERIRDQEHHLASRTDLICSRKESANFVISVGIKLLCSANSTRLASALFFHVSAISLSHFLS